MCSAARWWMPLHNEPGCALWHTSLTATVRSTTCQRSVEARWMLSHVAGMAHAQLTCAERAQTLMDQGHGILIICGELQTLLVTGCCGRNTLSSLSNK